MKRKFTSGGEDNLNTLISICLEQSSTSDFNFSNAKATDGSFTNGDKRVVMSAEYVTDKKSSGDSGSCEDSEAGSYTQGY